MLEAIMKSNPGSQFMYVVDTRPKASPYCRTEMGVTETEGREITTVKRLEDEDWGRGGGKGRDGSILYYEDAGW